MTVSGVCVCVCILTHLTIVSPWPASLELEDSTTATAQFVGRTETLSGPAASGVPIKTWEFVTCLSLHSAHCYTNMFTCPLQCSDTKLEC